MLVLKIFGPKTFEKKILCLKIWVKINFVQVTFVKVTIVLVTIVLVTLNLGVVIYALKTRSHLRSEMMEAVMGGINGQVGPSQLVAA